MLLAFKRFQNKNKPPLRVYWWRYRYPEKLNFGDEITPSIIEALWGRKCEWADPTTCELAGAGSIIETLQREAGDNKVKIWGSGFIKDGPPNEQDNLDFYAVRGLSSLKRITPVRDMALGDPGILMNRVFKRSKVITHKVGIVYHYVDKDHPALDIIKDNPDYLLIDPLQTPEQVTKQITSCRLVLSSSLHGLIVADSFGVPNYWLPLSDKVMGGEYKFNDYYSSTDRELVSKTPDILGNDKAIDEAITSYKKIKRLRALQRDLIKSFPY